MKEREEQLVAAVDGMDVLNALAWGLRERDPEQARILAEHALELALAQEENGHPYLRGTAQALIILGELANRSDAYGLALTHLLEAYTMLRGQLFPNLLADASHSIGWAHFRLENYDEALNFLNQALNLFSELRNREEEAAVLTSIGTVYSARRDYPQAVEKFQRALAQLNSQEATRTRGITLNNLAYAQLMLGANDEAVTNALAGIQISRVLDLPSLEAKGMDMLGQAFIARGDLARAEEMLQECLTISRRTNLEYLEMEALLNLGKVFHRQGRIETACDHLCQAIKIAEMRRLNLYRYNYHEILAKIYEEGGRLKDALHHYKEFHNAMDLAMSEAANFRMQNLNILHQVEKNRKEAEVLRLSNRALESEIDERVRERAELEKLATIDPLTGLFNRRHFFTLGQYEFEKAHQDGNQLSVILMDIDHFKLVNDHFNHSTGDQVLIAVARLFSEKARKEDICCRYGGRNSSSCCRAQG